MPVASHSWEDDLAVCRQSIRKGSKSFHAASLLLPKDVRNGAYALYAFCRYSDDVIDLGDGDADAVARLQERLERACVGEPEDTPVDRAFAHVLREYAISQTLPAALIEGLAWDAAGRRYNTIEDLHDYCARVAGSVGAMMAVLMGAREKDAIARATDLGVAMQLTNIARDVGEDARAGRVYLPLDWLQNAGVDVDEFLVRPVFTPALGGVVKTLLDEAQHYYERGLAGVDFLPMRCRAGIVAAAGIYAEIGQQIASNGYDSITRRAVVSMRRKLIHLAGAVASPNFAYAPSGDAPLPANEFLVDAVTPARRPPEDRQGDPAEQVLDLILRLERRDRKVVLGTASL